jgi:glucose/arabinose dehydrogenase
MRRRFITITMLLAVCAPLIWTAPATAQTRAAGLTCGTWSTASHPRVNPEPAQASEINDGKVPYSVVGGVLPGRPTGIAVAPDGAVYVAVAYNTTYPLKFWSAIYGSVFALDQTGAHLLIDGLHSPSGLLFIGNDLYVSELGAIIRIASVRGTTCGAVETVLDGLPFDDVHQTNGLAYRAGRIYVSQGLTYDPMASSRLGLRGTIFSMNPDGSDVRIIATGLRNAFGLTFDSAGNLWTADNGPNANYDPGVTSENQVTPDELDRIQGGHDYGFHPLLPAVASAPAATPAATPVARAIAPMARFPKHAGAAGIAWNSQSRRLLIALSTFGQVVSVDPQTGAQRTVLWNLMVPTALAIGPNGNLYIGEWMFNRVVRIRLPVPAPPD